MSQKPRWVPASHEETELFYTSPGLDAQLQPRLRVGLINDGGFFVFFYSDGARFAVERLGREVWADWSDGYSLEDACTYLYGPVLGFVLRLRRALCLHASAICVGDGAIALTGSAGAGKSTTAAAFARSRFPVLSDDVVALQESRSQFLVQPGYPRLNLWPDSAGALFGSDESLPRITPTWDKCYVPLDDDRHRFASSQLPLRAIYILSDRDALTTPAIIEELSGSDAFMALVANTYVSYLLDRTLRRHEFEVLSRLIGSVPVRLVRPTADPRQITRVCEVIAADAARLPLPPETQATACPL